MAKIEPYCEPITIKQALSYEVAASWWAPWIPFDFLQDITAAHFYRKARKKHKRYLAMEIMRKRLFKL